MVSEQMIKKIETEEGFSDVLYKCPADYWTIGYGFNLEAMAMPKEVADAWLVIILEKLTKQLLTYSWFADLDDARRLAITDMSYQMGVHGVMKFGKMIAAIREKQWDLAADEMLDSVWARQTPNRAKRNAEIMRTGRVI